MGETNNKPLSAQQRKGQQTKRAVLDATKVLLAESDFHSLRLDQVANAVGISKTSILWHFGSREELLTAAVLDLFSKFESDLLLEKPVLPALEERLFYVFDAVAAYFESNPEIKAIILSLLFDRQAPATIRDRVIEHLKGDRKKLIELLSTDGQTVSDAQATAIIALIHGCYVQWYADGCPEGLGERLRQGYALFPLSGEPG